ncbi:hypothetical protein BDQ17DRAFT_1038415 [Cyathus striatus]|nr:hypothetical protein BDQ17DRAFT_1038415 [Cyathus striatus]
MHLHRIGKADSPNCRNCSMNSLESVEHYLLGAPPTPTGANRCLHNVLNATGKSLCARSYQLPRTFHRLLTLSTLPADYDRH